MKRIFILLVITIISGCASTSTQLSASYKPKADEGVIAFDAICNELMALRIQKSGEEPGGYLGHFKTVETVFCDAKGGLHALPLPAGDYYFSQVFREPNYKDIEEWNALQFTVKPATITYGGEVFATSAYIRTPSETTEMQVKRADQALADQSQAALQVQNPQLVEQFSFELVPFSRPDTD